MHIAHVANKWDPRQIMIKQWMLGRYWNLWNCRRQHNDIAYALIERFSHSAPKIKFDFVEFF